MKIGFTRDARLMEQFLARVEQQLVPLDYADWHIVEASPALTMKVKLQRAGLFWVPATWRLPSRSLLQSVVSVWCFPVIWAQPSRHYIPAPRPPSRADVLVLESTYGDRLHEGRNKRTTLLKVAIEQALDNQGTVIIPAFSIGEPRSCCTSGGIIHRAGSSSLWQSLEIIVDLPLAARFTQVYRDLKPFWDE